LRVFSGSKLELNKDITLSEFYVDGQLQALGTCDAKSNPSIPDFSVYFNHGKLKISGIYEKISIYNIAGQLIREIKTRDGEVDFNSGKGVYLVSNGMGKLIKISVTNHVL
jgi:hypothetical protein